MKLNLGCGDKITKEKDVINVDIQPQSWWPALVEQGIILVAADLTRDWPWKDNSIEEIVAKDILEHLPDQIHTMNEAYRVLKPGGLFHIWVPTTDSLAAFADPTHKSFWNVNSFYYFTKTKNWGDEGIYPHLIPHLFDLVAAKPFLYRDVPQSRGIYIQLRKPVVQIEDAPEANKENEE